MKKYSVILSLLLVVVMLFAVGCNKTPDVNPDNPDKPGGDGWNGNWDKPDQPGGDDNPPAVHVCQNACDVCGKCLTDCTDEKCKDKCFEQHDRTKYVFNAADNKVDKKGGLSIEGDHLGNINENPGAEVTYHISATAATTACLGATVSEMYQDRYFTACTPLYVNGEQYFSRGYLKAGSTVWTTFRTMWLGCIELKEGVNEIRFTGQGEAYNFKDFTLLSDVELTLVPVNEEHVCGHKNADGKCTDYTCNDYVCMDKDETGWTTTRFDAGDEKILKYATLNGNEVSLWNANEKCIGNMANGAITGYSDQTVVFSFEAEQATIVALSLNTSTGMSSGAPFSDMYNFTFNGETVNTGAKVGVTDNAGWFTYIDSKVIYLQAKQGLNTFVLVHKPGNMGDNIKEIIVSAQSGNVTLAYANKPGETVAVEGVTLATVGGVETIKKDETLQLVATLVPANATNRKMTFTSSDNDVATVDGNGLVTAVGKGMATITVTTDDGGKTAEVTITVTEEQQTIPVTSIYLVADKTGVLPEEAVTLTATVTPANATNKDMVWKVFVNDAEVQNLLTVNEDGTAVFVASDDGKYTIVVTATDGSEVSNSVEIIVESPLTGTDHFFEGENATLTGGISINTSDRNARSNTSLGNINENIGATVTFTVIADDNCRMGLYVALAFGSSKVEHIFTLKVNDLDVAIPYVFTQEGANWAKYDEFWFANVDLKKGANTIQLTVTGGCGNFDYITLKGETDITEQVEIKSVEASVKKELLKVGDTVTCDVTVLPVSALESMSVSYETSNDKVVTVNDKGVATAVGVGKATITITIGTYERKINLFVVDVDGTAYEAEGDSAERTNVSIESNGKYVGGINNDGAKVTFTVDGGEGGKVFLRIYTSVVSADKMTIDKYYKIAVNGTEIELSDGQFAYNGNGIGWNTDSGYFTIEVELTAGGQHNRVDFCRHNGTNHVGQDSHLLKLHNALTRYGLSIPRYCAL